MGKLAEIREAARTGADISASFRAAGLRGVGGDIAAGGAGGVAGMLYGNRNRDRGRYANFRGWVHTCIAAIARRFAAQSVRAGRYNGEENAGKSALTLAKGGWRARALAKSHPVSDLKQERLAAQRLAERGQVTPLWALCKSLGFVQPSEVEVLPSHPVLQDLAKPNRVQGHFEFWFSWVANLYLTGESYIVGENDGTEPDGTPRVIFWSIPTHWVIPDHDGGLFTGYKIRVNDYDQPEPVPVESVARAYFPNPADLKGSLSPVLANILAVETDQDLQQSQRDTYSRGIIPNVLITVGKMRKRDGQDTGQRPRLSGGQRRQVVNVVNRLWKNTTANGDPGIIDGFIEKIERLSNSPQEMDWINSGEILKSRIFQAFGVNPYIVGEVTGVNKAQAVVAERAFCDGVVNPLLSNASRMLTDFVPAFYAEEGQERNELELGDLLVWFDASEPGDEELELKRWDSAAAKGFVSESEFRAGVLGLPVGEDGDGTLTALARSAQGAAALAKLASDVQAHNLPLEAGKALARVLYGVPESILDEVFPEPPEKQPPPAMVPGQVPGLPAPEGDGEQPAENDGESDGEPADDAGKGGRLVLSGRRTVAGYTRDDLKQFFATRAAGQQAEVAAVMSLFFRGAS